MARGMIVAGNWKMNLGRKESVLLARGIAEIQSVPEFVELLIFPATVWLAPVSDALQSSSVRLGAQNCHSKRSGAYTGEVSATMLSEICSDTMAGHSERRHLFGETDDLVEAKVRAILDAGMRAILCVGETLDERESGEAESVVERQLQAGLNSVTPAEMDDIVIAYEPVWAIGTGVAATAADAQSMCQFVRSMLTGSFGKRGHERPVLYGGSVTPSNSAELFGQQDIDGGLVGGASLDVQSFRAIVAAATSVR